MLYLQNASDYLLQALIAFFLYAILLRFWMQWVRADFRNPLGQFVITITNPVIVPLRKILPSMGTVDSATLVLAFAVALLKLFAFLSLRSQTTDIVSYSLMGLGVVIKYSIYLFMAAIFAQIIASWVNPHSYHPILSVARSIAEPILAPARRLVPAIGGIDFSPPLLPLPV
jgi:YggT family protein